VFLEFFFRILKSFFGARGWDVLRLYAEQGAVCFDGVGVNQTVAESRAAGHAAGVVFAR
jgi:hypothetical protein